MCRLCALNTTLCRFQERFSFGKSILVPAAAQGVFDAELVEYASGEMGGQMRKGGFSGIKRGAEGHDDGA